MGTQPANTTKTVKFVELTLICCNEHSLLCLLKMDIKVRKFWIGVVWRLGFCQPHPHPELRIKQFSNTKNAALEGSLIPMGFGGFGNEPEAAASISQSSMI